MRKGVPVPPHILITQVLLQWKKRRRQNPWADRWQPEMSTPLRIRVYRAGLASDDLKAFEGRKKRIATRKLFFFFFLIKESNFFAVNLQLTCQFACLGAFLSFILPASACQERTFDNYCRFRQGQSRKMATRRCQRSTSALITASPSINGDSCVIAPAHDQTPDVLCYSPRSWSELRNLVEVWSSP